MGKLSGFLYGITRTTGRIAGKINTVETLMSGDPKKIVKHVARKAVYKRAGKTADKITRKFLK